ncbi:proprotein convertase P-domain-containing protein [Aporhodopirellula aestuarii]|uniref:Proprotein convertase P-domain-containing protein n=1 Tax=Aporhodopirellula aestuarii TaxID=2950107 RepID=A0ABT0U6Y0_9BACT|nr:proprotein convertase P-domain-containing protein [Aporhodopirellula aestuarii]MCM2372680.1 proprotein convertase P-domain-containing protein [Aporhodopirellula aestuarii]
MDHLSLSDSPRQKVFIAASLRWLFVVAIMMIVCGGGQRVFAQAGLRESLEQLDTNGNGEIDPKEITPLARPYLERIAEARRMSLDRPNRIDKLQEAARIYYAKQNGVAREEVRPERVGQLRPFGTARHEPLVPEFGIGDVKYPYTEGDLDEAEKSLRRYDRDRDGTIDRDEARRGDWTHRDPFADDLNKDDRLSRLELAQRYARRRMLSSESSELLQKVKRAGTGIEPSKTVSRSDDYRGRRARGGTTQWLSASIMGRFDLNRNGKLEREESARLGMPVAEMDLDRNGEISREELHQHLEQVQEEVGGLNEGIPGWFYERDIDRDNQVSLAEFAPEPTPETIAEFVSWDANDDGLITTAELMGLRAAVGGTFRCDEGVALPPGRTVISEIEIDEDFLIADLNVQLSITHSYTGYLDAYLTGPGGERIELFTEVGGTDDNFNETIFDDQATNPIVKGRPPFEGSYIPEGLLKREPGLSIFNGKSVKGIWQLVIRGTRSDRFGMLHSWSLQARPLEN